MSNKTLLSKSQLIIVLGSFALFSWQIVSFHVEAQAPVEPGSTFAQPALTVTVGLPQMETLEHKLTANGNIAAWQEAVIGTEANGLRLDKVLVNVGDQVHKGQILATFSANTIGADYEQTKAQVLEAEANAQEAFGNADRARTVKDSGALSSQQIDQYLTAERSAKARVAALKAALKTQQLRLSQTKIVAPDEGVISSRTATIGAVLPNGQELFRMIIQNRLEWRAEVPSAEHTQLTIGSPAKITTSSSHTLEGQIRMLSPTIDPQTRMGIVYVDIPNHPDIKPGMFVKGEFGLGGASSILIPADSVVMRDGFSYVFQLDKDQKVKQVKIQTGRRSQNKIEVLSGLDINSNIVTTGAGFLNDGDLVKIVKRTTEAEPKVVL